MRLVDFEAKILSLCDDSTKSLFDKTNTLKLICNHAQCTQRIRDVILKLLINTNQSRNAELLWAFLQLLFDQSASNTVQREQLFTNHLATRLDTLVDNIRNIQHSRLLANILRSRAVFHTEPLLSLCAKLVSSVTHTGSHRAGTHEMILEAVLARLLSPLGATAAVDGPPLHTHRQQFLRQLLFPLLRVPSACRVRHTLSALFAAFVPLTVTSSSHSDSTRCTVSQPVHVLFTYLARLRHSAPEQRVSLRMLSQLADYLIDSYMRHCDTTPTTAASEYRTALQCVSCVLSLFGVHAATSSSHIQPATQLLPSLSRAETVTVFCSVIARHTVTRRLAQQAAAVSATLLSFHAWLHALCECLWPSDLLDFAAVDYECLAAVSQALPYALPADFCSQRLVPAILHTQVYVTHSGDCLHALLSVYNRLDQLHVLLCHHSLSSTCLPRPLPSYPLPAELCAHIGRFVASLSAARVHTLLSCLVSHIDVAGDAVTAAHAITLQLITLTLEHTRLDAVYSDVTVSRQMCASLECLKPALVGLCTRAIGGDQSARANFGRCCLLDCCVGYTRMRMALEQYSCSPTGPTSGSDLSSKAARLMSGKQWRALLNSCCHDDHFERVCARIVITRHFSSHCSHNYALPPLAFTTLSRHFSLDLLCLCDSAPTFADVTRLVSSTPIRALRECLAELARVSSTGHPAQHSHITAHVYLASVYRLINCDYVLQRVSGGARKRKRHTQASDCVTLSQLQQKLAAIIDCLATLGGVVRKCGDDDETAVSHHREVIDGCGQLMNSLCVFDMSTTITPSAQPPSSEDARAHKRFLALISLVRMAGQVLVSVAEYCALHILTQLFCAALLCAGRDSGSGRDTCLTSAVQAVIECPHALSRNIVQQLDAPQFLRYVPIAHARVRSQFLLYYLSRAPPNLVERVVDICISRCCTTDLKQKPSADTVDSLRETVGVQQALYWRALALRDARSDVTAAVAAASVCHCLSRVTKALRRTWLARDHVMGELAAPTLYKMVSLQLLSNQLSAKHTDGKCAAKVFGRIASLVSACVRKALHCVTDAQCEEATSAAEGEEAFHLLVSLAVCAPSLSFPASLTEIVPLALWGYVLRSHAAVIPLADINAIYTCLSAAERPTAVTELLECTVTLLTDGTLSDGSGHQESHSSGHQESHSSGHQESHSSGHQESHSSGHQESHTACIHVARVWRALLLPTESRASDISCVVRGLPDADGLSDGGLSADRGVLFEQLLEALSRAVTAEVDGLGGGGRGAAQLMSVLSDVFRHQSVTLSPSVCARTLLVCHLLLARYLGCHDDRVHTATPLISHVLDVCYHMCHNCPLIIRKRAPLVIGVVRHVTQWLAIQSTDVSSVADHVTRVIGQLVSRDSETGATNHVSLGHVIHLLCVCLLEAVARMAAGCESRECLTVAFWHVADSARSEQLIRLRALLPAHLTHTCDTLFEQYKQYYKFRGRI